MTNINVEPVVEKNDVQFPVIGTPAPAFVADTTAGEINFPQDYAGKWVILFSHPADFTPVCTTEFMTFQSMYDEFKSINTELVGLSIDSVHAHLGWLRVIRTYSWNGIEQPSVEFPVIADIKMDVAKKYGMLQGESDTNAVRAVFFIDPNGIIRTILYYPAALGRNFAEIKRIVVGLQKADKDGVALPANWEPGKDVIVPPPATCKGIEERMELVKEDGYDMKDWFLTFKTDADA